MATTIQTRIALKYDTLDNWENSSFILKKGEAAIAIIDEDGNIKIKIGDGEHKFSGLPWVKAEAEIEDINGLEAELKARITEKEVQDKLDEFQEKLAWPENYEYDKVNNVAATVKYVDSVLSGINGAMHFKGEIEGNTFEEAITNFYSEEEPVAGDVVLYGLDEYVYDGNNKWWIQLDKEGLYQEKLNFTGVYDKDTNLVVTHDTLIDESNYWSEKMGTVYGKVLQNDMAIETLQRQVNDLYGISMGDIIITDFMRFRGIVEYLPIHPEIYVKNDVVLLQKDGIATAYILNETITEESSIKEWVPLSTSEGSLDLDGYIKKDVVDGEPNSTDNKILTQNSLSAILFNCGNSTDE